MTHWIILIKCVSPIFVNQLPRGKPTRYGLRKDELSITPRQASRKSTLIIKPLLGYTRNGFIYNYYCTGVVDVEPSVLVGWLTAVVVQVLRESLRLWLADWLASLYLSFVALTESA